MQVLVAWHTDGTFIVSSPKISALRSLVGPPYGGNTLVADPTCAYRDHTVAEQRVSGRPTWLVLTVLCAATSAYSMLQSLVVPALATLQNELHIGAAGAAWIFTSYLLSASVVTPVIGRAGDLYGKTQALVGALIVLGVGAVISALATTLPLMITGRVLQGAGGAVFPLGFALVRDVVPASMRVSAIAAVSASLTVSGALGTVLAGVIVGSLGYHWLFWTPAGLIAVTAAAAWRFIPRTPPARRDRRIGWTGAALLALWLTALLLAISVAPHEGVFSRRVTGLLAGSAALAVVWARFELGRPDPLVDVRALWSPTVRGTNAATVLLGAGMFGAWMLMPLLLQQARATGVGLGVRPAAVGLYLLPNALGTLAVTPLVGRLSARFGPRTPVVVGATIASAGYALLAAWHGGAIAVCAGLAVEGAGIGLAFAGIAHLVVDSGPAEETGVATGVNTICRTVGGSVGTTVAGAVLAASAAGSIFGRPSQGAYELALAGFAVALALSAATARSIPRRVAQTRYRPTPI